MATALAGTVVWSLCNVFSNLAGDPATALAFIRGSCIGSVTIGALSFHMLLTLEPKLKPRYGRFLPFTYASVAIFVVIALVTIVVYPARHLLPQLIEPEGLAALLAEPGEFGLLPGFTGLALATVVATVTGLVAAVVLYRLTWGRGGPTSDAFTALGLVILAVAEIQYALWPSVYTNLVTISDMMRFRSKSFGV